MKTILKYILAIIIFSVPFGCSNNTDIAPFKKLIFSEDFPEDDINYNATFDFEGWTNFAETGTKRWIERDYNNDGYIQFSPFGSNQASNIGWAITPTITISEGANALLSFTSASNFVDNPDNKLEVFISENFDGTNVLAATWLKLDALVANNTTNNYTYIPSGEIDLSVFSGPIHIAFKVTGNGTTLDGLFQVDKVKVFSNN